MFNKLRSAVSSALPGNPLAKDFDVLNHVASGGPGLLWKIYNAMKKTTKHVIPLKNFYEGLYVDLK